MILSGCNNCTEEGRMILTKPISSDDKIVECCKDLKKINSKMEDIAYCSNCGDKICIMPEEYYNCPEDCQPSASELAKEKKKKEQEKLAKAEEERILCKDQCGDRLCQTTPCDLKNENCTCTESESLCEKDCSFLIDIIEFNNAIENPLWINELLISEKNKSLITKKAEQGIFLRATLYKNAKAIKVLDKNTEQIGEIKISDTNEWNEQELVEFLQMHK